jgi:type IV pilus assembly protein PilO
VLVAALYWYFLYQPYIEEMGALQEKINAKRQTVEKHKQIAVKLDAFKAQVSDLEARLHVLLRELPESREIPGMIRQISDVGVRTGLQISLIKPQPEQRKEFYAEIPIQVRVKGQYHAVGRFFDDLAHLERIISVNGIQIEATSQETQCLATTFRFLDEAEANEVAASAKKGGKK